MACIILSPVEKDAMISRRYIEALFNSGDPNFGVRVLEGASLAFECVWSWCEQLVFLQLHACFFYGKETLLN